MTLSVLRRSSCQLVKSSRSWYVIQAHENIIASSSYPSQDTNRGSNPEFSPQLPSHALSPSNVFAPEVPSKFGSRPLLTNVSGSFFTDLVGNSAIDKFSQSSSPNRTSTGNIWEDDRPRRVGSKTRSVGVLQIMNELLNKLHLPSNNAEISPLEASSVKKKRRLKMNKHKHRKLRRRERHRNK